MGIGEVDAVLACEGVLGEGGGCVAGISGLDGSVGGITKDVASAEVDSA